MKLDKPDFGAGLGLGIGFVSAGALCLKVPEYVGATAGWTTFWYATGAVLALIGIAGAAIELDKLLGSESGLGYIGASLFVAGLGGISHLLQARNVVSGSAATSARVLAVVLVLFSLTGFGMGVGQLALSVGQAKSPELGASAAQVVMSSLVAVIGLVTAILNFLAAGG